MPSITIIESSEGQPDHRAVYGPVRPEADDHSISSCSDPDPDPDTTWWTTESDAELYDDVICEANPRHTCTGHGDYRPALPQRSETLALDGSPSSDESLDWDRDVYNNHPPSLSQFREAESNGRDHEMRSNKRRRVDAETTLPGASVAAAPSFSAGPMYQYDAKPIASTQTSIFIPGSSDIPGLLLLHDAEQILLTEQRNRRRQQQLQTMNDFAAMDTSSHHTKAPSADVEMSGSSNNGPDASNLIESDDVVMGDSNQVATGQSFNEPQIIDSQNEKNPDTAQGKASSMESDLTEKYQQNSAVVEENTAPEASRNTQQAQPDNDREMIEKPSTLKGKAAYDPDFLAAAEAQKDNEDAEWQFDTSDAESDEGDEDEESSSDSSDDSDSDSDSDSDAEDAEFPRLSLAEQAKILMAAEGDEDGDSKPGAAAEPLRTKHELPEDSIEVVKPEISLTEADPIEELGEVQSTVGKLILIKAKSSGENQVLNEGSVVTLENREVIGVVSDLLGRVQDPLYVVRFKDAEEITKLGITSGKKIFFSPKHSTFLFTKILKAQKGSDASNLHDEEVDENEIEFSDDEAEAEYKRKQKMAKKSHSDRGDRGGKSGNSGRGGYKSGQINPPPSVAPIHETDEPYTPLTRPPNLSELMKNVAHVAQQDGSRAGAPMHNRGSDYKGRGGGSGRGRDGSASKGGRGGYNDRRDGGARGGRGGNMYGRETSRVSDSQGSQSSADPYDPTQSHYGSSTQLPQIPAMPQGLQNTYPAAAQQNRYNYGGYVQSNFPPQSPQQAPQGHQLPFQFLSHPPAQGQQIYNYQNQTTPSQSPIYPSTPISPSIPKLPQGAHVNPAFFARQAQAQSQGYFNPQTMWNQPMYPQQQQQQQQQQYYHMQQQQHSSPQMPQGQFAWSPGPSQSHGGVAQPQEGSSDDVMKAVQDQLDILKGLQK